MSALMKVGRQVRKPALHRSRIAEPSPYIADPSTQAGGDGQDNDGQRKPMVPLAISTPTRISRLSPGRKGRSRPFSKTGS